jgi:hypothetical protein
MANVINAIYYIMAAVLVVLIINNFVKSKKLQDSAMYMIILVPLLLRLLKFK